MSKKIFWTTVLLSTLVGCAGSPKGAIDPYEDFNRDMFAFNLEVDKYAFKPVSIGYHRILPRFIKLGISNFFSNLSEIPNTANHLLQFEFGEASFDGMRFIINTAFGWFGLVDTASFMGLERQPTDFGQTLRTWGFKQSPYVMLPILGPSTINDTIGKVGDYYLNVYPYIHKKNLKRQRTPIMALRFVDARTSLLPGERILDTVAVDEYAFIRDAYLQTREHKENGNELDDNDAMLGEPNQ